MNTDTIESRGVQPLLNVLKAMGGWPLLEGSAWDERDFKWYSLVWRFRQLGYSVDYLLDFSVTADLKNSSWRVLDLDQPKLGISREYLTAGLQDREVAAYLAYMIDITTMLGADRHQAEVEMLEVLQFEMQLANISLGREERRDSSLLYNRMVISDLYQLDPNTPWLEYVNNLLTPDILTVGPEEPVIVEVPSYVRSLGSLLQLTPGRVQANYLMWRAASSSLSYLSHRAEQVSRAFSKETAGKRELPPRWMKCVTATSSSLANAMGSLYVSKYFRESSRAAAVEMVEEIRTQFSLMLDRLDWMDEVTRANAKEKAEAMETHIGYPIELLDMKTLDQVRDQ